MAEEGLSEEGLALAAVVRVGGVEVADSLLDGMVDHGGRMIFVDGFCRVEDVRCLLQGMLQGKSDSAEFQTGCEMFAAGASSFVPKSSSPEHLAEAIRTAIETGKGS